MNGLRIEMASIVKAGVSRSTASCISLLFFVLVFFPACNGTEETRPQEGETLPSLAEAYRDYFPIGTDMEPDMFPDAESLLIRQFSAVTPCPDFLFEYIHPREDEYDWAAADRSVAFAGRHGMIVQVAHLVWGYANPEWLFLEGGGEASKETMLNRLEEHIKSVVGRYKGKVDIWNVVNEVVADPWFNLGEGPIDWESFFIKYKKNRWYEIVGEEYVEKAFRFAHEADPHARLFFNEYNLVGPLHASKRKKTYDLLKELLDRGTPIHGLGIQGHWAIDYPDPDDLREVIEQFAELGLEIQITELDVSSYTIIKWALPDLIPELESFTPELESEQADRYEMIFEVCREKKDLVTGVTLWGVSDRWTWLRWAPDERMEWPLLFDDDLQPKEAFWRVTDFDGSTGGAGSVP